MIVYGLKTCDRCRLALRELQAAGVDAQLVDLRAEGVGADDLARFHAVFGDDLVNRRSTTWRGLDAAERDRPALDLLADHPTLMKRPVIECEGRLFPGWGPDSLAAVLGARG